MDKDNPPLEEVDIDGLWTPASREVEPVIETEDVGSDPTEDDCKEEVELKAFLSERRACSDALSEQPLVDSEVDCAPVTLVEA